MSETISVEKQTLEALSEENRLLKQFIKELKQELDLSKQEISHLKEQVATLNRRLYGKKSERFKQSVEPDTTELVTLTPEEQKLLDEVEEVGDANIKRDVSQHYEALERETITIDLPKECQYCRHCQGQLHQIGKEVSEQLEYVPSSFKVKEIVRYKYGCRHCEIGVSIALKPGRRGKQIKAGPGLLAYLLVSKYCYHLPLYRLEQMFKHQGYPISRSTLCDWVSYAAQKLTLAVEKIKAAVLTQNKINTDDTVLPVQDPQVKGRTRTGRMWVYTNEAGCVYEYTPSRSRDGPSNFLKNYQGTIQADGYSGYNECCALENIHRAGCWAHVRRKFYDVAQLLKEAGKPHVALAYIQRLYKIEREIISFGFEHKKQLRQKYAQPILDEFKKWLKIQGALILPKSSFANAIQYTLKFWKELSRYCEDGHIDIDNNAAERAMRPVALGRKNWLFAGSHHGGSVAAIVMSVIETAKLKGLNVMERVKGLLSQDQTKCSSFI
ncbi:MAG: IS66 family transposase [Gammaproteobacteria bacterium]|jgi:transposase|nr:IS66 family transposase [Gammaproteobacteria bacterium]